MGNSRGTRVRHFRIWRGCNGWEHDQNKSCFAIPNFATFEILARHSKTTIAENLLFRSWSCHDDARTLYTLVKKPPNSQTRFQNKSHRIGLMYRKTLDKLPPLGGCHVPADSHATVTRSRYRHGIVRWKRDLRRDLHMTIHANTYRHKHTLCK